ncbi:MAG: NUDIX hydrolase [Natronospirillum sp.]
MEVVITMKYCSVCATPVEFSIPEGDNLPRYHCPACKTIHYQNPRIITCTLPIWNEQILLCKRNIEPRWGYWTLPGGFMENGESVAEGALRETWEEARNTPTLQQLFSIVNLPQFNQVHMFYLAKMTDCNFEPTPESLEVALFDVSDIPWDQIAFRTVYHTLRHYEAQRHNPHPLPLLEHSIEPPSATVQG